MRDFFSFWLTSFSVCTNVSGNSKALHPKFEVIPFCLPRTLSDGQVYLVSVFFTAHVMFDIDSLAMHSFIWVFLQQPPPSLLP